jgi:hypothetical protein
MLQKNTTKERGKNENENVKENEYDNTTNKQQTESERKNNVCRKCDSLFAHLPFSFFRYEQFSMAILYIVKNLEGY